MSLGSPSGWHPRLVATGVFGALAPSWQFLTKLFTCLSHAGTSGVPEGLAQSPLKLRNLLGSPEHSCAALPVPVALPISSSTLHLPLTYRPIQSTQEWTPGPWMTPRYLNATCRN